MNKTYCFNNKRINNISNEFKKIDNNYSYGLIKQKQVNNSKLISGSAKIMSKTLNFKSEKFIENGKSPIKYKLNKLC